MLVIEHTEDIHVCMALRSIAAILPVYFLSDIEDERRRLALLPNLTVG